MILFHKETDAGQAVGIRDLKQTTTGVATGIPSNQKVESFAVDSILCRTTAAYSGERERQRLIFGTAEPPIGSISTTALSCLVYPPREEQERSAGSFPEQRLVSGPKSPVAIASRTRPLFQNTKSFPVKSLHFEPLVSDHLS